MTRFLFSLYHYVLAVLSAFVFGFPSRKLIVIGITGTSGKSTVVWLLARILERAGYRVAASSSIKFQIADRHWPNTFKMTMPGRGFLQKFLRDAVREKCTHAVIEVTSEGIRQHRHRFIDFAVGVFLNISPEHIERHGSYEKYREAKRTFLQSAKTVVLNTSDAGASFFLVAPRERTVGFHLDDHASNVATSAVRDEFVAENISTSPKGIAFTTKNILVASGLSGRFNVENALAAVAAASAVGVPVEAAVAALKDIAGIPGRFERIPNERGLTIIVDYAHTPVALQSVYETAGTDGKKLTCVLGAAGGGRDTRKRPELGKLAAKFCEHIIVTDEDPYDEDPAQVREAVLEGVRQGGADARAENIADRKVAIRRALEIAPQGSAVVITGKGSEPWMMLAGGKKTPWDDRKIVREITQQPR